MKTPLFVALVALAWSASAPLTPVAAQYYDPMDSVNMANQAAMTTLNAHIAEQAKDPGYWNRKRGGKVRIIRKSGSRPIARGTSGVQTASGSTRFRFSSATRRGVLAAWVARVRAVDPPNADKLQRDLLKKDPIANVAPVFPRYGMHKDDVADAMTIYLVGAWYGVRGSNQDPPRALVRGVREQMREVLLSLPQFASASNADKQQLADTMILQAIGNESLVNGAKGKSGEMAKVKSLIRQTALKGFKLDLSKMKLTAQGFRA